MPHPYRLRHPELLLVLYVSDIVWHLLQTFSKWLLPQRRKRNGKKLFSEWDDLLARV